jgi:hypothetical protein
MRKHNVTREERALRREKVLYLLLIGLWAVLVIAMLYGFVQTETDVEDEVEATIVIDTPPTAGEEAQVVPEDPVDPTPIVVIEEPEVVAVDPVREDIPLDADTQRLLYRACDETGIEYELALAVIRQETNFQNIVGDGGNSIGYMQVQPRWHNRRMERHGVSDLADPYGNFLVGCDYLAEMIGQGRGIEWALHAYNGGPTYANKMAKAGQVSEYAENVLNYMNDLKMEEEQNGSLDF